MITLYSYPDLFGVADNNPYGLKTFAFLKLSKLRFRHEYVLDPKDAPRGQLPYIVDDGALIGDSDAIAAHLIKKYGLPIDAALTASQRDTGLLIRRMLDDLYWVMSYSRWRDEQVLAAIPGRVPEDTCECDSRCPRGSPELQFPKILLPGYRTLRTGPRL
jgi:glutathione S-transferase